MMIVTLNQTEDNTQNIFEFSESFENSEFSFFQHCYTENVATCYY